MPPVDTSKKQKKLAIFFFLLLATSAIASYLVITLWKNDENTSAAITAPADPGMPSTSRYNLLLTNNKLLSSTLGVLQHLDDQYAQLSTGAIEKKRLDSVNRLILAEEEDFRGLLDSMSLNRPDQGDRTLNLVLDDIILSYKSILQNRHSIGSLRNSMSLDKKSLKPVEMDLSKLQNELQEKNSYIASLESSLKVTFAHKGNKTTPPNENYTDNVMALQENNNQQENKIAGLAIANKSLKQDNEKLVQQQGELSKTIHAGELSLKNKSVALQQKIDELDAELRLAQVDCNLSRVDANQIISNSRQRKELLSEASVILTSLVKSDDADIKKKVLAKIARLNQVAANSRD